MKNFEAVHSQEIARNIRLEHTKVIAERAGLDPGEIEMYGKNKAKISLNQIVKKTISNLGLDRLPICMAKTQKSLSDDPLLLGRPSGFSLTVGEIEIAAGAGFLVPITGEMMRMPGLPAHPASENINIDNLGVISGLI